jgi:hypothetical protein
VLVVDSGTSDILAFARIAGPPDAPIAGAEAWTAFGDQRIVSDLPD